MVPEPFDIGYLFFSAMPESSAWQQICRWQMMEEEAAHKEEDTIQTGARPFQLFYLVEKKEQE